MAELLRAVSARYREATICTIKENATESPVNYDQKAWLSRAVGIAHTEVLRLRLAKCSLLSRLGLANCASLILDRSGNSHMQYPTHV